MKPLLLAAFCVAAVCASAQTPGYNGPWTMQQGQLLKKFPGMKGGSLQQRMQEYLQRKQSRDQMLSNKHGKLIILPQDNMPCIVPDSNEVVHMPNAWGGTTVPYRPKYHPIPNPGLPPVSLSYRGSDNWKPIPGK